MITSTLGCWGCHDHDDDHSHGLKSDAVCSPDSTLTYDKFGKAFMENYYLWCHSISLSGADRKGAPTGFDFDTKGDTLTASASVDEHAAAGPSGVSTLMPPSDPKPSDDEREGLGEWLACEEEDHYRR